MYILQSHMKTQVFFFIMGYFFARLPATCQQMITTISVYDEMQHRKQNNFMQGVTSAL